VCSSYCRNPKGDHDFQIVFHSNCSAISYSFRDNEVFVNKPESRHVYISTKGRYISSTGGGLLYSFGF